MRLNAQCDRGWRLREAPFPFQITFKTPLQELAPFVRGILSPFLFQELAIRIETVVFEPGELIQFLGDHGIDKKGEPWLDGETFTAENEREALELLEAVLGDWIDFVAIPSPNPTFAIYADHDEYITVFTQTAARLDSLRKSMKQANFEKIENWHWTGPRSKGTVEEG